MPGADVMKGKSSPVSLIPVGPYVTIELAHSITGYSEKAIERKIEDGHWVEGREWRKAPDGRRLISIEGYKRWVERGMG